MPTLTKTPVEAKSYTFDFSEFEAGGTISGYALSASQLGLTLISSSLVSGFLTITLAGGLPDWNFVVGARAIRGELITEKRLDVSVTGPALDDITTGSPTTPTVPVGALALGPNLIFFDTSNVVLT